MDDALLGIGTLLRLLRGRSEKEGIYAYQSSGSFRSKRGGNQMAPFSRWDNEGGVSPLPRRATVWEAADRVTTFRYRVGFARCEPLAVRSPLAHVLFGFVPARACNRS